MNRHHKDAPDGFPCSCGKPVDDPIHFPAVNPTTTGEELPHKHALGYSERQEVNSLMESAQYDLESVLFTLVWQREQPREQLAAAREALMSYEYDSNGHIVTWLSEAAHRAALAKIGGKP